MVDDGRRTDGRRTDGRTPDHGHPISSPCEPDGSGELTSVGTRLLKVNFFAILQTATVDHWNLFFT